MRRILLVSAVVLTCFVLPFIQQTPAAEAPASADTQRIEARFRDAISLWAYGQHWALWEMGSSGSKFAVRQNEFSDRMRRGTIRSSGGNQIDDLRVESYSPTYGRVFVRLGVESERMGQREIIFRSFTVIYEDGDWRISLHEFLALAR